MRSRIVILSAVGFVSVGIISISLISCNDQTNRKPDEETVTLDHMAELSRIIEKFHRATGAWPTQTWQFFAAVHDSNILLDGWGHEFHLVSHTNAPDALWLESYGADDLPGGVGTNADTVMFLGKVKPQ